MKNKLYIVLAVALAAIVAYAFYLDNKKRSEENPAVLVEVDSEENTVEGEEAPDVEADAEATAPAADPSQTPAEK